MMVSVPSQAAGWVRGGLYASELPGALLSSPDLAKRLGEQKSPQSATERTKQAWGLSLEGYDFPGDPRGDLLDRTCFNQESH